MPDNKILNIGAGEKLIEGVINVDIIELPGIDKVCDIRYLTFDSNEFDEVYAEYVLCQIRDSQDFKKAMNEVWRVLKPGGLFHIKVPNANFPCAFQDPMDCRYFIPETFDYFNKDHYRFQKFHYGFKPWAVVKIEKEKEDRLYVVLQKA
jgi:predicted SAM-dependent methyltransferase